MNNDRDVILKNIAENVRRIRKEKRLSQFQLSYRSDISRTNIGYIENAKGDVLIGTLCALAKALEVSVEDLITVKLEENE